ncbi:hypothetical protein M5K25_020418 [Dendrobium thyrsiflorum]|uniref:Protein SDA1 n=1 Tax=Dendrobium thyrsiflorum TaxID=117978 RepID=A0ABD0U9T6_DENTH
MAATTVTHLLSPESLSASGKAAERLSLPLLQSRMKLDPDGYEAELSLIYRHFESTLHLFQQQSALSPSSDPVLSKDLGDLAMFLAHMIPFYPLRLVKFPLQVSDILRTDARALPSSLRCHLVQAIILLVNRKIIGLEELLELFMDLQIIGDRTLRKLAFSHVVHSIRRMNKKHKNEAQNQKLQNVLFKQLQGDEELRARRSLIVLCDLHRRKVWFDERTANAICNACFHSSSRVMLAALSFLLGFEHIEDDADDSEVSSSDDDEISKNPQVVLSREDVYKAKHKGTASSKRKKKAKLQRVIRSMKRQQRRSSEKSGSYSYSPLGFTEKLFSRLHTCSEKFEVRMMMLKVIARTIGLHCLILLNFYPFLQRYVQPHQRDVTNLLAAGIQACHDKVPPDAVEPLFRQIVNQFVHDRSRPEAIAVGLNVVREMCLRMPLLMNEDLLQDLALYKKSHEKAVSIAARSLITLFREICPSLLVKKDRGRPIDPTARPKAFGEVSVASDVPGIELLQHEDELTTSSDDDMDTGDTVIEVNNSWPLGTDEAIGELEEEADTKEDEGSAQDDGEEGNTINLNANASDDSDDLDDGVELDSNDEGSENDDLADASDYEEIDELKAQQTSADEYDEDDEDDSGDDVENSDVEKVEDEPRKKKRKLEDHVGNLNAADASLRALKRLAGIKTAKASTDGADGFLSNEDFQRIKKLKERKEAKQALSQHGLLGKDAKASSTTFKIPSSEQLSTKRLDPAKLEAHIRSKLSKEERLALVRAGREDRGQYQARAAVKQKKTGGLSNRQKQHKKAMPLAAKRDRAARSRQEKKQRQKRSGKQFKGRKAWNVGLKSRLNKFENEF